MPPKATEKTRLLAPRSMFAASRQGVQSGGYSAQSNEEDNPTLKLIKKRYFASYTDRKEKDFDKYENLDPALEVTLRSVISIATRIESEIRGTSLFREIKEDIESMSIHLNQNAESLELELGGMEKEIQKRMKKMHKALKALNRQYICGYKFEAVGVPNDPELNKSIENLQAVCKEHSSSEVNGSAQALLMQLENSNQGKSEIGRLINNIKAFQGLRRIVKALKAEIENPAEVSARPR